MNANPKTQLAPQESSYQGSAEQRLKELGIKLPAPPEPFGAYAEAVQTGNLLFSAACFRRKDTARNSLGASARSSMWKRGARPLSWRRSTSSLSRGSIWDRSTE